MERYLVRRDGTVVDRATKYVMGKVFQYPSGLDCFTSGRWGAWLDFFPEAVGDLADTRHGAVEELYFPFNLEPAVCLRRCGSCASRSPAPTTCLTGQCESYEEARERSRLEYPVGWAHYDFVVRLATETGDMC